MKTNPSTYFDGLNDKQMWEECQKLAYRFAKIDYRVLSKGPAPVIRVKDGSAIRDLYASWVSSFAFDSKGNARGVYGALKRGDTNEPLPKDAMVFILSKRDGGGFISPKFSGVRHAN